MSAQKLPSPCGILCVSCRHSELGCAGCGAGGGLADCVPRDCSARQGIPGCWECKAFPCEYFQEMDAAWRGLNLGFLQTIREVGVEKFHELVMLRIGPGAEYGDLRFLTPSEVRSFLIEGKRPEGMPRG
jgi:hypothetical protein